MIRHSLPTDWDASVQANIYTQPQRQPCFLLHACTHRRVHTHRQTRRLTPAPALCHRARRTEWEGEQGNSTHSVCAVPLNTRLSYLSLLQPATLCKAGDEEIGTNWMKLRKEKSSKESFSVSSKATNVSRSRIIALDHGWPRGLPWKQQQQAGPHRPLIP